MEEYQGKQVDLIDTTDCLEAVGVFRGWKNLLFIIVLVSLLLLQLSFWAEHTGHVGGGVDAGVELSAPEPVEEPADKPLADSTGEPELQGQLPADEIEQAAKQVATEPNQPAETQQQEQPRRLSITVDTLTWLIRFVNFVLILAAMLYCLTMLFILKVSLLGRLGGINHIARAFFLSLLMVVVLLPWQEMFGSVVCGVMFTSQNLIDSHQAVKVGSQLDEVFYFLRFAGYWLLAVLLLICSLSRSCRWAKATLRRLEVV